MPLTDVTANALAFDLHMPSFGLYCENNNADIHGDVKYVVDRDGKAVRYCDYTVNASEHLTVYIPFVSRAYELPRTDITVNGKTVTRKVCYGGQFNRFSDKADFNFYSADIDGVTGTLYSLTPSGESFTVEISTLENQSFIYMLTNSITGKRGTADYSYTLNNALPGATYEIFVIDGDFARFESSAETVKETITAKQYIDSRFSDTVNYFPDYDNITPDVLYARINRALKNNIKCNYSDFFFDSYSDLCVNAYRIDLQPNAQSYGIEYSMPADVQKSNAFTPAVYLAEQTSAGNYTTDYTVRLNGALPYVIESSIDFKKQDDYIYTARNVSGDMSFVFSSSEKPESVNGDKTNDVLRIIIYVLSGLTLCFCVIALISWYRSRRTK